MVTVRRFQPKDLDQIQGILVRLQQNMLNVGIDSWSKDSLVSHSSGIWVAEGANGDILAFLVSVSSSAAVELLLVGTDPLRQRQGVGRSLMLAWLGEVRRPVWLEVHEANRIALGLYRSLGFEEVGRRPRYYRDGGTAVSMTLQVEEPS